MPDDVRLRQRRRLKRTMCVDFCIFVSMIRIAINGFGRIGRRVARLMDLHPEIKLVAVNDLADKHTLLHLLQYDSTHGFWQGNLSDVQFLQEQNIANLPWKDLQIDLVLECSGVNKTKAILQKHLDAGAKKVLLSAPRIPRYLAHLRHAGQRVLESRRLYCSDLLLPFVANHDS